MILPGIAMWFLSIGFVTAQEKKELLVLKTSVDTTKTLKVNLVDTLALMADLKYKPFKRNAHASYYSDKFNGRRTASGTKFNNDKYTAAHRRLPFGTKLRLTNEVNGKSVIVEVTDRGPFSKAREIDLTKRAFMDLAHNKKSGGLSVTIEEIIPETLPKPKL